MTEDVMRLRRVFATTPERLFDAWIMPEVFALWIGPEGVPCEVEAMDPVVGGAYSLIMEPPGMGRINVVGRYEVIERPGRIALSWESADAQVKTRLVLEIRAVDAGAELVLSHYELGTEAMRESHRRGWESTLNKMETVLGGMR